MNRRLKFAPAVSAGALCLGALCFGACKSDSTPSGDGEQIRQGHTTYSTYCTACHNVSDPSRDGSLAPAIKGSSLELLEARVLRGEYPPGYAPKRATHIMQKLPLTQEDVAAIHAYLNAP